jgi:hypothetical protein
MFIILMKSLITYLIFFYTLFYELRGLQTIDILLFPLYHFEALENIHDVIYSTSLDAKIDFAVIYINKGF